MIAIGTRLGSYQITSLLGQGGMGEVYRATDSKLNRDVALKLLPPQFLNDSARMERFQREAHVLASLNHSNIAAIYGLEDSNAMRALVMELVEGPTLANRIGQGPIPIDETLNIAKQIAEALEYAHERGVIHRDLKPANIKLTPEGQVKVLDFGLAKAINNESQSSTMSNSPTLSLAATQAGVILGTAAYMSPEQAKGKTVDRRSDIWAFGVVVYEMLTGKMMFSGETVSETMAQVMMKDPDWTALPATTPARLRDLLRRCLTRDPRYRIRDIGDVRIAIEEIIAQPEAQLSAAQATVQQIAVTTSRRVLPWSIAAALAVSLVIIAWAPWRRAVTPDVMRMAVDLGADASLTIGTGASAFLSPDGKLLAFLAAKSAGQKTQIYIRKLDQLQATVLSGTDGARNAFFSPDGVWIAFFADGKLKKISVNGGAAVTLCDAPDDRGGAWGDDGLIVFAPTTRSGLFRVSSVGGTPEELTKLDGTTKEITHRWPQVLPGSKAVLFISSAISNTYDEANITVESVGTHERKILQHGFYPHFVSSGHLVYVHQGTVFAVPFDSGRLAITGQSVPILESVMSTTANGASQFAFSQAGSIVYLTGEANNGTTISWLDSSGKTQPLRSAVATYLNPRFSPDGRRIAFEITEQQYDVWIYEWERDTMSRLTTDVTQDSSPVWTPDGRRIAFASQRGDKSTFNIYWQKADGTGDAQRLTESKNVQQPMSWHPSGKYLAFVETTPQTNNDVMILPIEGDEASGWKPGKPTPFLATFFQEWDPAFSPDGRWIAYRSNESGSNEVYVRPFPDPGGRWQISTAGGLMPTWSRNGKELFYRTADSKIMVITYQADGDVFRADKPRLWSDVPFVDRNNNRNFDLHPDGRRFAIFPSQVQNKLDKVTIAFNFFEELRRVSK